MSIKLCRAWDKNWYHIIEIPVETKFSELPIEVHVIVSEPLKIFTFATGKHCYANLELGYISGVC